MINYELKIMDYELGLLTFEFTIYNQIVVNSGMKENAIQQKSYAFASRIIKAYKYLVSEKREFVLAKQVLRSGTSIGANVEEALAASSTADFISKLNIAAKEARETSYWLRVLHDNDFLSTEAFDSIHAHNLEISKLLSSILLSTKANAKKAGLNS